MRKSKVLLIQPLSPVKKAYKFMPFSLGYMAAVLEKYGWPVEILDFEGLDVGGDEVDAYLESRYWDIVGLTCATVAYPEALRVARKVKGYRPDSLVVIGGCHVSFTAKETLEDSQNIDVVVQGEGELTLPELCYAIEGSGNLHSVKGITYRDGQGNIHATSDRYVIADLDEIPFPSWHLLPMDKYNYPAIVASRGCPAKCIFCSASASHKAYRTRKIDSIIEEMRKIVRFIKPEDPYVVFFDNSFSGNYNFALQLADEIKRSKLGVEWTAEMRVDNADKRILQAMREAGCVYIHFGAESGSQTIIDSINKHISIAQIKERVSVALELGFRVVCSFMVGHPEDTEDTVMETIDFIKQIQNMGAEAAASIVTPYPGTEIYEYPDKYGVSILDKKWDHYTLTRPLMNTKYLTAKRIGELFALSLLETRAYYSIL